mgnify:CR=1 FL=1
MGAAARRRTALLAEADVVAARRSLRRQLEVDHLLLDRDEARARGADQPRPELLRDGVLATKHLLVVHEPNR